MPADLSVNWIVVSYARICRFSLLLALQIPTHEPQYATVKLHMPCNQSHFKSRRCTSRSPLFVHNNFILSFCGFEVEILKQWNKEEKDLLTSQLFTEARTLACNIQHRRQLQNWCKLLSKPNYQTENLKSLEVLDVIPYANFARNLSSVNDCVNWQTVFVLILLNAYGLFQHCEI